MIALALSSAFGIAFGYFLVGPVNHFYSARQYGLIVTFLAFMFGFGLFMALVAASYIEGRVTSGLPSLLLALGFWTAYSASAGIGAYVHNRRRPPGKR